MNVSDDAAEMPAISTSGSIFSTSAPRQAVSHAAARVVKYIQALGAPVRMRADVKNIAVALAPSMVTVLARRPDLADLPFDIQPDRGRIRVVSGMLNARDTDWLQAEMNGNRDLLAAVRSFHDDAVAGYVLWSEASGAPLSQDQRDAVSRKADGLVRFLSLFRRLGSAAQKYILSGWTYTTSDGIEMDFGADPTHASGFLVFYRSAQAAANGTFSLTSRCGHTLYGRPLNIFDNDAVVPHFFPAFPMTHFAPGDVARMRWISEIVRAF